MQEKRMKVWKRATALLMSAILVAVSLPLALAAPLSPGTYDPVPVFEDTSALWAWETESGDVTVSVPEATVNTKYIAKSIATYYITLYDLGVYTQVHNDPATENVPQIRRTLSTGDVATLAAGDNFEYTFDRQEMAAAGITLDGTHRLCVEVLAQDSTGWVSEAITTIVSDVPRFEADDANYTALAETNTNMREVIMMEAANNDGVAYVSGSGTAANGANYRQRVESDGSTWARASRWADGALDYIANSSAGTNQLAMLGTKAQAGAEDPDTGVDTSAYGFRVTGTGDQSFATTWSRQHWDLSGAEEVWYWFDFSQVSVQDLAFELKAQGKRYEEYYWDDLWNRGIEYLYGSANDDDYSTVTYSTKGYTGDDGYVLLQTAEGSWERVALENGGIDLSGYKGYIRVPIQFICSTTDTYVEARNDNWGFGGDRLAENVDENEDQAKAQFNNNVLLSEKVRVDRAGTPISAALLIQYRQLSIDSSINEFGGNSQADKENGDPNNNVYTMPYDTDYAADYASLEKPYWGAAALASGPSISNVSNNTSDSNRAYVQTTGTNTVVKDDDGNAIIVNRENGYKAIQDIAGAGFSYTSMSADSVNHSFYMDSVMTYKSSGEYPEDMVDDPGRPLTDYYNQRTDIQNSIITRMEELITSPDLGDYRAVQYIDEMLAAYREGYKDFIAAEVAAGRSDFLSGTALESAATAMGSDGWNNFVAARQACLDGGTIIDNGGGTYSYPSNNGTGYENVAETGELTGLVPELIRLLEKLPDPDTIASVSDELEAAIVDMWHIYRQLNLTQLNAISAEEEAELIAYFNLSADVLSDELLIGQAMANNAFVLFNTFGTDSAGEEVYRLDNDANAGAGQGNPISYRFTKGLLGYTSNLYNFHGADTENDSSSSHDVTTNGIDVNALRFAGSDFAITNNGASSTAGMTVTLDNAFAGEYNVVSVSKNSVDTNDAATMYANNMAAENLGDLANYYTTGDNSSFPLGLVFYVDFSELSNFRLTATISSRADNGTALDYAFNPGASVGDQTFFMMNEETGEWVRVQGNGNASSSIVSYGLTNSEGVNLQLDGYRGYIMLPLWHFKKYIDGTESNRMLSRDATGLNNIWRVSIGVAPIDSASAQTMDGRSFTIDSIGFGYDSSSGAYGDHGHQTFGEQYGIKTFRAAAFEDAVAAIEPSLDTLGFTTAFRNAVAAAENMYAQLSSYETQLPSTRNAYAILQQYRADITAGNIADYQPELYYASDLTSWMDRNLDDTALNASTTGEYDLPYPGVIDTDNDGTADAVNYAAYGLTPELAQQIIHHYEYSYSRYSDQQKAELGAYQQQFLNAYNAAMRCVDSLEPALEQSLTFLSSLYTGGTDALYQTMSQLYPDRAATNDLVDTTDSIIHIGVAGDNTVYAQEEGRPYGSWKIDTADGDTTNEGFFISVSEANLATLQTAYTNHNQNTNYFAKVLMADGSIRDGAENVSTAVEKLIHNTQTTTDGLAADGGVVQLLDKYQTQYEDAAQKMADGTFTATDRTNLLNTIAEYESLIPTYHDVAELYDIIQQMYDLTPAVSATLSASTMDLSYDNRDTSTGAVNSANDPVYTLTQFERYLTDTSGTGTLTITSSKGGNLTSADGTITLPYTLTLGGSAVTFGQAISNVTLGQDNALHVTVPNAQPTTSALSDTLTLTYTYQYTDRNGILREATDVKQLTVNYATGDFYTVTVPAEVQIDWGTTTVSNIGLRADSTGFSASGNLSGDAYISVDSEPAAATLTMSAADTAETISVSAQGIYNNEYSGSFSNSDGFGAMLTIDSSEWENKPLAEYRATDAITYTVTYSDGSTTP